MLILAGIASGRASLEVLRRELTDSDDMKYRARSETKHVEGGSSRNNQR
jgi:hypothetical protein